jgi:heme A synthase
MSKSRLAQALVLGALLATTNLAGMTAIAHAQSEGGSVVAQDDRRPPTEGQVGESWHQRPAATSQQTLAGEVRRAPTEGQVGEPWHPRVHAPTPPADQDGPPRWPVASLAVLAAVLALTGGLVAKRASARVRPGLTA